MVNEPHVRPDPITNGATKEDNKSPETNNHACKFNCALCGAQKLGYNHYFTNCGDSTCDVCWGDVSLHERAHRYTAESPVKCVDCGTMFKYRVNAEGTINKLYEVTFKEQAAPCDHQYDNACDVYCNSCNYQRYGWQDGSVAQVWHIYENTCDTTCNDCGATREIEHTYPEYECAKLCKVCGFERETTVPHTYSDIVVNGTPLENSSGCDSNCDVCGEVRVVAHVFAKPCSTNCSSCGAANTNIQHAYTDDCDEDCNYCGDVRDDAHTYSSTCDDTCNVCGATREAPDAHVWDNACDTECNRGCGTTRTIEHKYDNACDTTCNICANVRTVGDHVYDNACDTTCNECQAVREVGDHVYDNNCDNECNVCGAANANFADHVLGEDFTKSEDGFKVFKCTVCQADVKTDEKAGLGGGAIAGIVSGSGVVLAAGAFAIYWFVFKKRG